MVKFEINFKRFRHIVGFLDINVKLIKVKLKSCHFISCAYSATTSKSFPWDKETLTTISILVS